MIPPQFSGKTPTEIAALNTREALDYFWSLPNEGYFSPERTRLFDIVSERVQALFPVKQSLAVIDVGCGPGQMFQALRRDLSGYDLKLVGVDWAASAIAQARVNVPAARFFCMDLHSIELTVQELRKNDLVLCVEVLEHQEDWIQAMNKLTWLAKPGGHIIITVPNGAIDDWPGHRQFWPLEDLRRDFAHYGLVSAELIKDDTNILAHLRANHATT
jgi:2-polyprenyl-3-methyl-5-hydroxy-6-metoxy-1,4-benzoquinol methylase